MLSYLYYMLTHCHHLAPAFDAIGRQSRCQQLPMLQAKATVRLRLTTGKTGCEASMESGCRRTTLECEVMYTKLTPCSSCYQNRCDEHQIRLLVPLKKVYVPMRTVLPNALVAWKNSAGTPLPVIISLSLTVYLPAGSFSTCPAADSWIASAMK